MDREMWIVPWLILAVFGITYYWTLTENPALQSPRLFIIFTVLMILHVGLHWLLYLLLQKSRALFWYFAVQGGLVYTICWIGDQLPILFALYIAMLGESLAVLKTVRRIALAVGFYLVLAFVNVLQLGNLSATGEQLLNLAPLFMFSLVFVILLTRQAEARRQAEAMAVELEAANRQMAEYADQVKELTLTTERQRMARELHDTLSQGVAGMVLQLEAVKAHLEAGRVERAKAIIDQSLVRARNTLAESRLVIDDLREIPDNLLDAIQAKSDRFSLATGIPCELNLKTRGTSFSPQSKDYLLKILNEALANTARHAQASQVWIRLESGNGKIELEIRDDGKGFNPNGVTGPGHYGLMGMRERARLAGGNLQIESGEGKGTRICFIFPYSQEM